MSTHIDGYRVKINKLNDLIDFIRPQVFKNAARIVRNLMAAVSDESIERLSGKKTGTGCKNEKHIRFAMAIDMITKISKQTLRAPGADISFELNIWLRGDYAYIIPVSEFKYKINFPSYAKDFSWFDHSDKPEDISKKEWIERAQIWHKINLGEGKSSHNARRLEHSVINFNDIYGDITAQSELEDRILGKKGGLIFATNILLGQIGAKLKREEKR